MAENLSILTNTHEADTALRGYIGYQLKRAYNTMRSDLLQELGSLELRMTTYSALVIIDDNPGLSQSELGAALEIKRSNMVAIVDELENKGWIERKQVESDRRAYAVFATRDGSKMCKKASELVSNLDNQLRQQLSPAEIKQLTGILRKIESTAQK